jgi:Flp pilus assembly protein TadD
VNATDPVPLRGDEAMTVLKEYLVRHPNDRDTLVALIGYHRDARNFAEALRYAKLLAAFNPNDPDLAGLISDLSQRAK